MRNIYIIGSNRFNDLKKRIYDSLLHRKDVRVQAVGFSNNFDEVLINKNYDFQHRSLKLLDRLFEKFPDFILNVREEKREIVTDFINNINEEKFSYYKIKLERIYFAQE